MPNEDYQLPVDLNEKILDEIGPWSLIKHDVIKGYAAAYSRIMAKQKGLHHVYIDAFCGPGLAKSKETGRLVYGSALHALQVSPPFEHYYFIDNKDEKTGILRKLVGDRDDVTVITGDCNKALLKEVFPYVLFSKYKRGLCLLDPYGLDLEWDVIEKAGKMRSIELFVNFPIMHINRTVIRDNPEDVSVPERNRMVSFWGGDDWYKRIYMQDNDLFEANREFRARKANDVLTKGYADRLSSIASFEFVPEPIPMRNSIDQTIYYLFFASHNSTGKKIVIDIFNKYRNWRMKKWLQDQA